MLRYGFICGVLIVAGAGCASSQADKVKDARNAQIDQQTVEKTRAIEERQDARQDAIEHRHDVAAKRVEAQNRPDESAAKEQLENVADRQEYESKAQGKIETIGVHIQAAQQKLAALGTRAPAPMEDELKSLEREQRMLERDLRDLPNTPMRTWENKRDALDKRISGLNSRVKDLTSKIEDV